jgi:hypothetical protein
MANYADNVKHKNDWLGEINSAPRTPKVFTWDFRDVERLPTFWFSDIHWGHKQCDKKLVEANIKRVVDKQMPCVDLGDLIENATRDSVGSGVYEQETIAQEQMEQAVEMYKPLVGLLQCMHPGNHELRTMNSSGVNLTRVIAKMLGVPYGGVAAVHYILVGNQRYLGYSHHGGSGATTIGGKVNSLLRMEKIVDADFYIQGHTHDTIYQARQFMELDKRTRTLKERSRHFINNGAYLDYWGSYGQVKAYSPGTKGNAQITFSGEKHEIEVSFV